MKRFNIWRILVLVLVITSGVAISLTSCGDDDEVVVASIDNSKFVGVWSNGSQAVQPSEDGWYAQLNIGKDVTGTWVDDEFEGRRLVSEVVSKISITMISEVEATMTERYVDAIGNSKINKYNIKVVDDVLYIWEDSKDFERADRYYRGENNYNSVIG